MRRKSSGKVRRGVEDADFLTYPEKYDLPHLKGG